MHYLLMDGNLQGQGTGCIDLAEQFLDTPLEKLLYHPQYLTFKPQYTKLVRQNKKHQTFLFQNMQIESISGGTFTSRRKAVGSGFWAIQHNTDEDLYHSDGVDQSLEEKSEGKERDKFISFAAIWSIFQLMNI